MSGNNFYIDMQKFSTKVDCYVANGTHTPERNGRISEYNLYVNDLLNEYIAPKQKNLDKLINYAKKFKFDSVKITNKKYCSWLTFTNLVV
jgi:hypothetical protein